jgi:phosphatidylserine/phosphatidylglycerophosphate/cardiolipin synthase-like enzyme
MDRHMKKTLLALVLFFSPCVYAQNTPFPDMEIVESTPVGTSLDNSDVRNTHEVWLEMIGRTQRTLDIEQFYISNESGKLLEDILAAVYAAADRNVKVRIIVDARMYKTYPASVDSLGRYRNIETRRIDFGAIARGVQHAKYFIVDEKEVFVGSQNFDWRALEHIHELGLRIHNKEFAAVYEDVFNLDWQLSSVTAKSIDPASFTKRYQTPIRISTGTRDDAFVVPTFSPIGFILDSSLWDERVIVKLINGARQTLTLQFLSYSILERGRGSYTAIDDAIRNAAKRGVKVKMIVSDWEKGSPAVRALKDLSSIPNIEVAFTSIPQWSGGYIPFARVEHCKYIVADNTRFWLGSSNCEKSYYYSTRNLGAVCNSPSLAGTLARIFLKSWDSPYKELITRDGEYKAREHGERR